MNSKKGKKPERTQKARSAAPEGVYSNAHFMYAAASQIGNIARIKTPSGSVWEGIFKTYSNNFDVVLELATKVKNPDEPNSQILPDTCVDKLIFKATDILALVITDVDLNYATKNISSNDHVYSDKFETDAAISARSNGNSKPEAKELEPWTYDDIKEGNNVDESVDDNVENIVNKALESGESGRNGWDALEMFQVNEKEYGVTTSYDASLSTYTCELQQIDSPDYREAQARANLIASEIESHPQYKARLEMENGDEETQFAAVIRPHQESKANGKYLPPAKRKNQYNGKLVRNTPPPSQSSSSQNTPSPKETRPPVSYQMHPSPHQTNVHVQQAQHVHNANIHPSQIPIQQQSQQNVMPNHGRPHSHTPPHQYQPPVQVRQVPPQIHQQQQHTNKPQMNGEVKPVAQRQRNVYNHNQQQYQHDMKPPEMVNVPNHPPRHRDDTIKDLHAFSQDFKLAPPNEQQQVQGPPPPVIEQVTQVQPQIPPTNKHPQQASPPQPQQSISPQQESLEKVTNTLKKSTLNPNAKEFVLNPAAKPFQPRSPSTPSASRPHTPQTPSHSPYIPTTMNGPGVPPQMPVMMYHVMTSQPQYQPPPQGNRIKRIPMSQMRTDMASQMQVAAATGQPLLAPAPIQQFIYPQNMSQAYPPMPTTVRMYDTSPQIQYLPPNPHQSQTPSPAQPPQYNPAQGPQAPPQACQAAPPPQGHPQYNIMVPIISPQPHMMQSMQYLQQAPPPPQHPMSMLMHQHPGQGNHHGPNP